MRATCEVTPATLVMLAGNRTLGFKLLARCSTTTSRRCCIGSLRSCLWGIAQRSQLIRKSARILHLISDKSPPTKHKISRLHANKGKTHIRKEIIEMVFEQDWIAHLQQGYGRCTVRTTESPMPRGRDFLALLTGQKGWSMGLMVLRVRPTSTQFPASILASYTKWVMRMGVPISVPERTTDESSQILNFWILVTCLAFNR